MAETGRAYLASASERSVALEGIEGHGVFTHALLAGLRGDADGNHNGLINTLEMAGYLEQEVPRISRETFQYEQTPTYFISSPSFDIGRYLPGP